MSTTRTARRIITLSASVALIAAAPGLVGVASATDTPSPSPSASNAPLTVSPDLIKAIQSARDTYRTTTHAAKDAYKAAKKSMHVAIERTLLAQHDALKASHDALRIAYATNATNSPELRAAYETLKTAYEAAKHTAMAKWITDNGDARAALKTAIDAAQVIYSDAVKAAFKAWAPNMTIPAGLLEAPGKGHGYAFGHLKQNVANGHRATDPNQAASMGRLGTHQVTTHLTMGNHQNGPRS
jgi:hypothetical protein